MTEYFKWVWNLNENTNETKNFEEYVMEDFRFSAVNNYKCGFDFVDWLLGDGEMEKKYGATAKVSSLENLMNFKQTCQAITRIKTFYLDNYGNDFDDISEENVLRHLAYVELYERDFESICELLNIDESGKEKEEEKPACSYCGNDDDEEPLWFRDDKFVCDKCSQRCYYCDKHGVGVKLYSINDIPDEYYCENCWKNIVL
jgi:hypothetical protein